MKETDGTPKSRYHVPASPLLPTRRGTPLSRDAHERRIAKYTVIAAKTCPALLEKKVSPHVMRHSAVIIPAISA